MQLPILVIIVGLTGRGRISYVYSFRDIDAFSFKIARFSTPPLFDAAWRRNALHYQHNLYIAEKYI